MKARILAYHRISDQPAPGLETWTIRPAVFRRQVAVLRKLGFRGVSVRELLDTLDSGQSTGKLVGITFDDGYLDTVDEAFPILERAGFTASVYLVPAGIGGETSWEAEGSRSPLADWDDLRKLVDGGWELGMHSRSHPARFDLLTGADLQLEILGGLQHAQEQLATTIDTFAFPHGHFSSEALTRLEEARFRAALTTEAGPVTAETERYRLPRYEIKRRDTLAEFALMMLTGISLRRRATFYRLAPARLISPANGRQVLTATTDVPDPLAGSSRDAA